MLFDLPFGGLNGICPVRTRGFTVPYHINHQQETPGEVMGMPMNGIGITGYDNFIDDTGTAIFTMKGEMDAAGERDKKVKYTVTLDGPDRHTFRIYDVAAYGDSAPTVEMVYTGTQGGKK